MCCVSVCVMYVLCICVLCNVCTLVYVHSLVFCVSVHVLYVLYICVLCKCLYIGVCAYISVLCKCSCLVCIVHLCSV